jgi:nucleotide-binding universal stress UspA family protein
MKILLGVDNSTFAGDIVRAIAAQRRTENTEVFVLHVVQPLGPAPPQMHPNYAPELDSEKKAAHGLVERVAEELRSFGFTACTQVVLGDVREGILDTAADWHADLIVVGSHGQRGIQRFLLGSVSEFVARHAKCSVEIIRAPAAH